MITDPNPKEYNGFKILFKNMLLYGDDLKNREDGSNFN